jgi:hypothetical protein
MDIRGAVGGRISNRRRGARRKIHGDAHKHGLERQRRAEPEVPQQRLDRLTRRGRPA